MPSNLRRVDQGVKRSFYITAIRFRAWESLGIVNSAGEWNDGYWGDDSDKMFEQYEASYSVRETSR